MIVNGSPEEPLTEASFRATAASRLGAPPPPPAPPPPQPSPPNTAHASHPSSAPPQDGAASALPVQATRERESGPPSRHADFSASLRQRARSAVPRWGWRGRVHRWTKGRLSPRVSSAERDWNTALRAVQMTFGGPRSIVFVNPKGGTFTTTATLLAGRTFGVHRGGGVVAFDNNETRGTLGERAVRAGHANTARELLSAIDLFRGPTARLGDLGRFTRGQGPAHFDVLASDERPEATGQLGAEAFDQLHELFRRYYRLILIDSGNNVRAPAWLAAARQADLLVITTTVREDAASSALWMADVLERDVLGPGALKQRSVALVCDPAPRPDTVLRRLLLDTFGARCHTAMPMPFEPALVGGGAIDYPRLSSATHAAWLHACAAMASALSPEWKG